MRFLASLPTLMLVVTWLAVCGAGAVGTRWLLQRVIPEDQRHQAGTVAAPLMPALGAAFALLAALSLAGEAAQLRSAEDQASQEAAAASRLAWGSTSPGFDRVPVQAALQTYLEATSSREWESPPVGGHESALAALADLERAVRADAARTGVGSAQAGELLASLDALTSARRQRLANAHHGLPDFYVAVVALSGLALIANSSALALAAGRRVAYLPAGLVLVVGLALALLFAISGPFRGGFVVSRYPIDQVVADLHADVFRP